MLVSITLTGHSAYIYPIVGETQEGKKIIQYSTGEVRILFESGSDASNSLVGIMKWADAKVWLEEHGYKDDGKMFEECSGWVYRNYDLLR